ncbi:SWI/SNF and RSC complexes subunit ssr4 [Podospora australis]|uniref:SWI/SNF and RSC complexes subunit ssr4 n=1 Tax=Podospora australis TaxID=1536484 RepID=A0AAN6WYD7_9PEZI|nr:SWI/SNF and RSC complexes subunit ssr4 [Podospora australis]
MAQDPSQSVHQDLIGHLHLISTYRFAQSARVELTDVRNWLLQAPKIARDNAPFYWTYLDCPTDGTIFLTWQPVARRGNEFSSDGYYWASPEMMMRHDMGNGLIMEIFYQKCGWRTGETYALHSRRRFRLAHQQVPGSAMGQNVPQIDPNLWIVHYGPSEKQDRFPITSMQITPQINNVMQQRQHLFQLGQIVRKEFMLSDRVNWPQIPFPQRGQSMYVPPMPPRAVPQTMAYPPHGGPAGATPKRGQRGQAQHAKQQPPAPPQQQPQQQMAGYQSDENAIHDDEDIQRGDLFDHLSPREMSMHRYQQNHEWMEEILSSPYRIGQIEVADLGLGRKGELASLTEGIFEAQGENVLDQYPKKPYTGRLDPELADEFRKRVQEKNEALRAEIEQMKAQHEKRLAKFKNNATIKEAEQELRSSTRDYGTEFWRIEGRVDDNDEDEPLERKPTKSVQEITSTVEKVVAKEAVPVPSVHRVQDGGYQEPAPEPEVVLPPPQAAAEGTGPGLAISMSRQPSHAGSQASGVMVGDSDIDMGGTAGSLLDQMHTGFSNTSTPVNNFPTPQAHLAAGTSSANTPANINAPSPHPAQAPTTQPPQPVAQDVRVPYADIGTASATAPDQGTGSGDWVVVPKGGVSPSSAAHTQLPTSTGANQNPTMAAPAAAPTPTQPGGGIAPSSSKPGSAAPTPSGGLNFEGDNNDFSSLGDLDTAGDALANYDPPSVGAADDMHLDMEDSAFGEAFHGMDQSGNTPGEDR